MNNSSSIHLTDAERQYVLSMEAERDALVDHKDLWYAHDAFIAGYVTGVINTKGTSKQLLVEAPMGTDFKVGERVVDSDGDFGVITHIDTTDRVATVQCDDSSSWTWTVDLSELQHAR